MSQYNIIRAMSLAFFASAYAEQYEEAEDPGFSPAGCDWMDLIPSETDPAAIHAAENLTKDLARVNPGHDVESLLTLAEETQQREGAGYGDRDLTDEMFGHYLAMQAMGHGVGLSDAFGKAVSDAIRVPYVEFSSCSLERDYFEAREG